MAVAVSVQLTAAVAVGVDEPGGPALANRAVRPPSSGPIHTLTQPPPLWGKEDHVTGLLGDGVYDVTFERRTLPVTMFGTPQAFREYFKTNYGPTIAVYRAIADDASRVAALDQGLDDLVWRFSTDGTGRMEWEYLLVTARRG